uniref:Uncharacterized protein n=1 Tax=Arundo donax TaxID=35708 RepID=A0A0A9C6D7_ARUDO
MEPSHARTEKRQKPRTDAGEARGVPCP